MEGHDQTGKSSGVVVKGERMKMKNLFLAALVIGLAGKSWAIDFGGRLSLGGGFGQAYPVKPDTFKDAVDNGRFWTAHLKYGLADEWSFVASYSDLLVKDKTTEREIEFQPVIGSLRFHPFHKWPVSPYLTAGAGVSINRLEPLGAESVSWTKFAAQGGMGIEFFVNQGTSLGVEGLYHHIVGQPADSPYRLYSVAGMINIYMGKEGQTRKAELEAELAKQDAEKQRMDAEELLRQAEAAKAEALAANAAQSDAERRAAEMALATQAAQGELDKIKEMIARKDINPIAFAPGSSELLVDSYQTLNLVADTVKKYPNLKLRVEGHTDSQGNDAYNLKLSQSRANAVRNYLIQTGGLPASQAVAVGFGESQPIAPNTTVEGRAKNRRVEFIFFLQ